MNKDELTNIKEAILRESARRKEINELQDDPKVRKFLKMKGLDVPKEETDQVSVLKSVLSGIAISGSNHYYVLIGAFQFSEGTLDGMLYPERVTLSSKFVDYYLYQDIETFETVKGYCNPQEGQLDYRDFERENIVFNPNNGEGYNNGFDDVRIRFFLDSVKRDQGAAYQKLIDKYPRRTG